MSAPGGVSALGDMVWGGLDRGGLCSEGVVSQHALRQTPPLWTESQTPVKTLPWPNFVAAGNNTEVYEEPVPRTKEISHCAVKFEADQGNRIVYDSLNC